MLSYCINYVCIHCVNYNVLFTRVYYILALIHHPPPSSLQTSQTVSPPAVRLLRMSVSVATQTLVPPSTTLSMTSLRVKNLLHHKRIPLRHQTLMESVARRVLFRSVNRERFVCPRMLIPLLEPVKVKKLHPQV